MRSVFAMLLLVVAAFCVYGFIAAGESGPTHIYFRIGYPILGLACLAGAIALLMGGRGR